MMYDENFLKSFVERVETIYLDISKTTKYNTTILLCSLTGILSVLDDEARKTIFSNAEIPDYIKVTNISTNKAFVIDDKKDNGKENLAIIRHFRNSLCHFKLEEKYILADKKGNIEQILFEDFNLSERKTFSCCLTVKEIEKFMLFLIDVIKTHY